MTSQKHPRETPPAGGTSQEQARPLAAERPAGTEPPQRAERPADTERTGQPGQTTPRPERPDRPERPAGHGKGEAEAVAPDRLAPKEEALSKLLPTVLAQYNPVIGADIDEVTCRLPRETLVEACKSLKTDPRLGFDYLRLVTVVDYLATEHEFEAVYHIYSLERRHKMVVKARTPESDPWLPSVTSVWRGADWYEREMRDLFGVEFRGHPDPRKLILPDDFEGFPGRKDYPLYEYDEY